MSEINDEQFEVLMKTIDKFEEMLAQRIAEIRELHGYFRMAADELKLHDKRLTALEAKVRQ